MKVLGLVLDGRECHKLEVQAWTKPGKGNITLTGPITVESEHVLERCLDGIYTLAEYGELSTAKLHDLDLHLRFVSRSTGHAIAGESYSLALFVAIASVISGRSPASDWAFTGCVGEAGQISPVEGLDDKRRGATALGITRLFIPASQLDFFCDHIDQVPCETIYEAWSVLTYGS